MALARSGDNIILPAPFYFNHQMWLTMQGIEVKVLPTLKDASAVPSPAEAAALIDERTRAIILVTPNNPTGAVYPSSCISEFFELAQSSEIALVMDETYKDFRTKLSPPHDIFTRPDWRGTFVQLYSFSKVYALTGYRVGSVIADEAFLSQVEKIMDCVSICAPRISGGGSFWSTIAGLVARGQTRYDGRAAGGIARRVRPAGTQISAGECWCLF